MDNIGVPLGGNFRDKGHFFKAYTTLTIIHLFSYVFLAEY
jgi:hypothetical protein